jgi:nitroimidazol reductase NimA-like FMN-containing flavoprotein (pyridoxamine 5'-phosphate oxidase superfamily)
MWKTLSENEARELIARENFAHLGCVLEEDTPYVVPVNYLLREDAVYIHSLEGTKLDALRKNRKACVQVEDIRGPFSWRSAIAFGMFEELPDGEKRSEVLEDLLEHFRTMTPVEGLEAERGSAEDPVVFRIKIDRLTGVSES